MQQVTDTRGAVTAAIAESCYLDPGQLRLENTLSELGVDSLAIAYIVTTVEQSIGRKLPGDAYSSLFEANNVAKLVDQMVLLVDESA